MGKNPQNVKLEKQESFENEQKPVKVDDFNSDEEKAVKGQEEERKRRRREEAEKKQSVEKERCTNKAKNNTKIVL